MAQIIEYYILRILELHAGFTDLCAIDESVYQYSFVTGPHEIVILCEDINLRHFMEACRPTGHGFHRLSRGEDDASQWCCHRRTFSSARCVLGPIETLALWESNEWPPGQRSVGFLFCFFDETGGVHGRSFGRSGLMAPGALGPCIRGIAHACTQPLLPTRNLPPGKRPGISRDAI